MAMIHKLHHTAWYIWTERDGKRHILSGWIEDVGLPDTNGERSYRITVGKHPYAGSVWRKGSEMFATEQEAKDYLNSK